MSVQETIYYADQWMCEIPGVAGSLPEVAKQLYEGVLSMSNEGAWDVEPQSLGSRFEASAVTYIWVTCPRVGEEYTVPDDLLGDPHAVTFGEGKGWNPDMIVSDVLDARRMLGDRGTDDVEYLVCTASHVRGELVLGDGPVVTFEPESEVSNA